MLCLIKKRGDMKNLKIHLKLLKCSRFLLAVSFFSLAACGAYQQAVKKQPPAVESSSTFAYQPKHQSECHTAGLADSTLLTLNWFAQRCHQKPTESDCHFAPKTPRLTLHGLWPNKKNCGIKYNNCGAGGHQSRNQSLHLKEETITLLKKVMPAANLKSRYLIKHEWYKHGTCQKTYNKDQYFTLASHLTQQVNQSSFGQFLQQHAGKSVTQVQLDNQFDQSFGEGASSRLKLTCHKNALASVRMVLPPLSGFNDLFSLQTLPKTMKNNSCPSDIYITPVNGQRGY
jgi:ribonuclease T2